MKILSVDILILDDKRLQVIFILSTLPFQVFNSNEGKTFSNGEKLIIYKNLWSRNRNECFLVSPLIYMKKPVWYKILTLFNGGEITVKSKLAIL